MRENSWFREKILLGMTFKEYILSRTTFWNIIALIVLIASFYSMIYRLIYGLGPATNLSDTYPWGLWISFDILAGIALAAPGLAVGTAVYLFGIKDYKHFAKPAILSSLLGYVFAVFALMFDLGRYYRVVYVIGWSWGLNSILFLIAWHFFLYIIICFIEMFPSFFEWLGREKLREFFSKLGIWATVFGVIIAGGHQSALGGLFLVAPTKVHPLWYSALLPLFFLISAIFAGISMVIIESTISHKVFRDRIKNFDQEDFDSKTIGLAKVLVLALFIYLILKIFDLTHYDNWHYLTTDYGLWYLFENIGFVFAPAIILIYAIKIKFAKLVRIMAFFIALGVIINRFNVSLIAYNWYIPFSEKYYPTWMEIALSLGVVVLIILFYRFIVRRMPILS
ncbi:MULTISPECIES: NrfD/PsrC family molybdoenzyme membrane anchor subunit [Thermodesulfovibrio]|jgi:Ni/Fe-hydrogenase subunit HybB-like protein|uniref:NrfD/PsrC family molybdoenzyme membrane anchor subunit n=1 Tax=Thermodesulfovibrio yellowstonii TaxID=28262 RepID=UPI0004071996|nr:MULTISPECIES: NrfD/PsrC family molybdoenzyme membrane anchor subunit [Thermodesulfovibrio]MDI6864905.1 polysulfide reductase NrfD [Thermodesulfovibrio yellowstonii]